MYVHFSSQCALGPHAEKGYKEAKRILEENYGEHSKKQKVLIMEFLNLPNQDHQTY